MKAYCGSEGMPAFILDLGTRWEWPLYPQRKSPWYPLDSRLGGPQNRSGRGGEEKNSHPLPGLEPLSIQPVAQRYTTELYRVMRSDMFVCMILPVLWFACLGASGCDPNKQVWA
jgi:hypothetical protein